MINPSQINTHFIFSSRHKHQYLVLDNQNSTITNPKNYGFKMIALVQGTVSKNNSSAKFKVKKLSNHVGIGISLLTVVSQKQYRLKNYKMSTAHGCYLFFSDGWALHHKIQYNQSNGGMYFNSGDIIKVETKEGCLFWRNETAKWEFKMETELKDDQWDQTFFCAILGSKDDSVSIINPHVRNDCCQIQ